MAEHLNEYFSSVFIREDISALPVPETKFEGRESDQGSYSFTKIRSSSRKRVTPQPLAPSSFKSATDDGASARRWMLNGQRCTAPKCNNSRTKFPEMVFNRFPVEERR